MESRNRLENGIKATHKTFSFYGINIQGDTDVKRKIDSYVQGKISIETFQIPNASQQIVDLAHWSDVPEKATIHACNGQNFHLELSLSTFLR